MLRKEYIERKILDIQKEAEKLGLYITEFLVKDPRVITELEKKNLGIMRIKLKPMFVSPKNYNRTRLNDNEYGRMFGISFIKGGRYGNKKTN